MVDILSQQYKSVFSILHTDLSAQRIQRLPFEDIVITPDQVRQFMIWQHILLLVQEGIPAYIYKQYV